MIRILDTRNPDFPRSFEEIRQRGKEDVEEIEREVEKILRRVKEEGDEALIDYTQRFDGVSLNSDTIRVSSSEIEEAFLRGGQEEIETLKLAAQRIEDFHRHDLVDSWVTFKEGEILGKLVSPLKRVGIYVPGGKASYPSSVLMSAIPAKVAGVPEIILTSPPKEGEINLHVLVAAKILGISSVFRVGGAQAIAAMAYGTQSIPKVDKIVGPGNIFVVTAKRLVFGEVDIDLLAGPSEILVISDEKGSPSFIASDLLSQAEHESQALCLLITPSPSLAQGVAREMERQLEGLPRKEIIQNSLKRGAIIVTEDLSQAIGLSNEIAPENLELMVENPLGLLSEIKNAGSIFLGNSSPVPLGDYLAGPNHILPTGGGARFFSPLSTTDFLKRTNLISFSQEALKKVGRFVIKLAQMEGFEAHARAISQRIED